MPLEFPWMMALASKKPVECKSSCSDIGGLLQVCMEGIGTLFAEEEVANWFRLKSYLLRFVR